MPNATKLKLCPYISVSLLSGKTEGGHLKMQSQVAVQSCIGPQCTFWDEDESACVHLLSAQQILDTLTTLEESAKQQQQQFENLVKSGQLVMANANEPASNLIINQG